MTRFAGLIYNLLRSEWPTGHLLSTQRRLRPRQLPIHSLRVTRSFQGLKLNRSRCDQPKNDQRPPVCACVCQTGPPRKYAAILLGERGGKNPVRFHNWEYCFRAAMYLYIQYMTPSESPWLTKVRLCARNDEWCDAANISSVE